MVAGVSSGWAEPTSAFPTRRAPGIDLLNREGARCSNDESSRLSYFKYTLFARILLRQLLLPFRLSFANFFVFLCVLCG